MILQIDIHRYTDKDASLLCLKKPKTKQISFDLINIFLLTTIFSSFDVVFNRQLQNVFDHSLWDFTSRKWVLSFEMHQMLSLWTKVGTEHKKEKFEVCENTRLVTIIYQNIPSPRWNEKRCKILEFFLETQMLTLFLFLLTFVSIFYYSLAH